MSKRTANARRGVPCHAGTGIDLTAIAQRIPEVDRDALHEFADLALLDQDLIAMHGDLEPGRLLAAYALGFFPMGLADLGEPPYGWYHPRERGVLRPYQAHASRSLLRQEREWTITWDEDLPGVIAGCANPERDGRWITAAMTQAYLELGRLGYVHSVEVRTREGDLAGGLYGVALGGLFAAESKFHRVSNASKMAVIALARALNQAPQGRHRLIDVQWNTDHLSTLGARTVTRECYQVDRTAALALTPLAFSELPGVPH